MFSYHKHCYRNNFYVSISHIRKHVSNLQIFNVDEIGFSGKERQRTKVIGPRQGHVFAGKVVTNDHVTVNMCVCGDGRILPSMLIYKASFYSV